MQKRIDVVLKELTEVETVREERSNLLYLGSVFDTFRR